MAITLDGTNGITHSSGTNQKVSLASETAVASTSGTSVDFILSADVAPYVKRITVMFSGVSTSGTSVPLVQIGDSGGIETSGYLGTASINTTATLTAAYTTGFGITQQTAATDIQYGSCVLTNISGNSWVSSVNMSETSRPATSQGAGSKTLSNTIDRIRITTVNGTDTFDAGSINILYE